MKHLPDRAPHTPRILIVDDECTNRQLLETMLAPEGFVLLMAGNGEEALAAVARQRPDLILLDVLMPGMDGNQVAAIVKGNPATTNIPIIMVSALDDRAALMGGLDAGAEDFLSKPIDRAELRVRVRNLLRLKAYSDYCGSYSHMLEREVVARTAELVERTAALEAYAAALRTSDERTNFALGAAHMGVWELDLVSRRLTWSATMASVFGLTTEQAPTSAEGFFALIHPDDRQAVEDSVERGRANEAMDFEMEFRVIWPDGATHWVRGLARRLPDQNGEPTNLLGVAVDISERKSLEAQFRQAQKMDAIGHLAGGVAHDFNNLLTAMLGYTDFVLETFDLKDPRRFDLDQVVKAGNRAAGLTRQLLAFSRKQVLQLSAVDLNGLAEGMEDMLSRLIGEQVELVHRLDPAVVVVRADCSQLEQVLMNLVVNARDAMPGGGRVLVETANVELDQSFMPDVAIQPGSYSMLAVSDTGMGMSEATKKRLFEPFFTTKEVGKGIGLGLATVYGIVKQSGGYVWVDSELGRGTTFRVYLPHAAGGGPAPAHTGTQPVLAVGTETVCVVEDEEPVRILACRMLERAGYRVFGAAGPKEAEALFQAQERAVDLLVTDVIMPGSTGPVLFARLALSHPGLKVLYMSGYTTDTVAQHGEVAASVRLLQKPFSAVALNQRVREALDHKG
ncbi:MAG: response regulator [Vicinamibacterales bacterium]